MQPVIRLGDPIVAPLHVGTVTTAEPKMTVSGIPVACNGNIGICAHPAPEPVTLISATKLVINGKPADVPSVVSCGAFTVATQFKLFVSG